MKIKITITRDKVVLHSEECEVSVEGDIEREVSKAMSEARSKAGFGVQWGFTIHVDKA